MAELDLDARRAEEAGEPHKVMLGGRVHLLPAELPLFFADYLAHGELIKAVGVLLGPDVADEFGPSITKPDLDAIADLYGMDDAGKSPGSRASSNRATRRSKPTSKGSTG